MIPINFLILNLNPMKNSLTFILFIGLAFGMSSCSKEKNNDENIEAQIVGTWKMELLNFNGKVNGLPFNHDIKADASNYATITFKADGTYTSVSLINIDPDEVITEPDYDNGIYSIANKKLRMTSTTDEGDIFSNEFEYELKGGKLKISAPEDTGAPVPGYDILITMTLKK